MEPWQARSVAELIKVVSAGGRPKYVHFWGHRPAPDGSLTSSCFSQWWGHPFDTEGHRFATAEHYMMWRKARLFGDEARASEVLVASSPAAAKAIGRLVSGFDQATWEAERWEIVVSGSVAKFGSDAGLRDFLAATKRRVLVEASPRDRIWGIGLGKANPRAENPSQWRGLNLLGFALMEARERLAA